MIPQRRALSAVLVVAMLALLVVGTVWATRSDSKPPSSSPAPTPSDLAGSGIRLPPLRLPSRDQATVIIGDSWTEGVSAEPRTLGYASLVSKRLGGRAFIYGQGGTGYVNGGVTGKSTFAERIARLDAIPSVRMLIIQGGLNDLGKPALGNGVETTIAAARRKFPEAQIVIFGILPLGADYKPLKSASSVIAYESRSNSAYYVDPSTWLTRANTAGFLNTVTSHPTTRGHAVLAQQMYASLVTLSQTGQTFTP